MPGDWRSGAACGLVRELRFFVVLRAWAFCSVVQSMCMHT